MGSQAPTKLLLAKNENPDQTAQIRRPIQVFTGCSCDFVMLQPISITELDIAYLSFLFYSLHQTVKPNQLLLEKQS